MAFSGSSAVLLVLLGFAVGAFGTLVGAGGGFILAPVLLVLYPHDSAETLSSISIAVVFFNALSGSLAYARQRRIDLRVGGILGAATLPGSIAGALLVSRVPRHAFDVCSRACCSAWCRIRLELPRHRRRSHPRSGNEPDARVAGPHRHGHLHFVLAIMSGTATLTHPPRATTAKATDSAVRSRSRSGSSSAPSSEPASRSGRAGPSSNDSSRSPCSRSPRGFSWKLEGRYWTASET